MTELMSQHIASEQFALDQRVEDLLAKLLNGTMTESDHALYNNLNAKRSGMMRLNLARRAR